MGLDARKPALVGLQNNKDVNQPAHSRSLIRPLLFAYWKESYLSEDLVSMLCRQNLKMQQLTCNVHQVILFESIIFAYTILVLFDLIFYVPSKIFQLNRDGSSWVEPVLSSDKCVLLKDHNPVTPGPRRRTLGLYTILVKNYNFMQK